MVNRQFKGKNPCYMCEDRYGGCHAECEKYKEWKENHEKNRENIQAEKNKAYNLKKSLHSPSEIERFAKRRREK